MIVRGSRIDDRDKQGLTALLASAFHGYYRVVGILVKHGAKMELVDKNGYTALMYACTASEPNLSLTVSRDGREGRRYSADILLVKGCNANAGQPHETPPLLAAAAGCSKTVQHLLYKKADTTRVNCRNFTPLMIALSNDTMIV